MERKELKQKLTKFGYSNDSIKSLLLGRMKPNATKMFEMEKQLGIPVHVWSDIKNYLRSA